MNIVPLSLAFLCYIPFFLYQLLLMYTLLSTVLRDIEPLKKKRSWVQFQHRPEFFSGLMFTTA